MDKILDYELMSKAEKVMLERLSQEGMENVFSRAASLKPCPFGEAGLCCRTCYMGPCRFTDKIRKGSCGVSADVVVARNFARAVAAGTAAHSDHARAVAQVFSNIDIDDDTPYDGTSYKIIDKNKLEKLLAVFEVDTKIEKNNIKILGQKILAEFGKQNREELYFIKTAPKKRQAIWRRLGITPSGIDREITELLHRTSRGTDQEVEDIILAACRTALADGWGGSMIATFLQDILFRTPVPVRSKVCLGVLKKDKVNIIIHGHEPLLSEIIVALSKNKDLIREAEKKGANGINIAGICCTANEVLMRHGVSLAGNFLSQELAIGTGAVEAMVVDVQCIFPGIVDIASCFHTKIITTSEKAKITGAIHKHFSHEDPIKTALDIIRLSIENFENRNQNKVFIPDEEIDLIAGFSSETISYMLGGRFRASYRPLNDAIIDGRIRGVVGLAGCNNPKVPVDIIHTEVIKELISENVLVLHTGCAAIASAKGGLLVPDAAELAGPGLREVCEAVGMPPALHCGACVDNSRLLVAASEMVGEGGLGNDVSDLPVCGGALEWMSEKALAIGHYFVTSGVNVVFGVSFPVDRNTKTWQFLSKDIEELVGAKWHCVREPSQIVSTMIDIIDTKRKKLGIDKRPVRILYDMAMRRELKF